MNRLRWAVVAAVAVLAAGQVVAAPAASAAATGSTGAVPNQSCTTVAVGDGYTLALREDGTVVGMGHGVPAGTISTTPVTLTPPGFISVSATYYQNSLAVRGDGALFAWNDNSRGSLFLDGPDFVEAPTQVPNLSPVVAVSGGSTSLALTADGQVWSAGDNDAGQLGIGTTDHDAHHTPAATPITNAVAVASGLTHELALTSDGTVLAWGSNFWGELGYPTPQLGFNNYQPSATPGEVPGLSDVVAVAAGSDLSVALKADGSVWTWGLPQYLGFPTPPTAGPSLTPQRVASLPPARAIAVGGSGAGNYVLVVLSSGEVMGWGVNATGQLGDGTTSAATTPVLVAGLTGIAAVSANYSHSAALDEDGQLWQWGDNVSGQFGNATTTSSLVPVLIGGGYALPYQCTAGPGAPPLPPSPGTVALLGDSYSSGEGAGPYDPSTATSTDSCHRSANSWQRLFVSRVLPADQTWTQVACSGAVLTDYWHANSHNRGEPAQNGVLDPGTAMVLLTLAGNDINFRDVAQQCIEAGLSGRDACKSKYVVNGVDTELQVIQSKQLELTRILVDARTRAPNAAIYVSTYPNIISDDPRLFCLQDGNLAQSDRQWLKGTTRSLDDMVASAALAAGVHVIDVFDAFAGHELCTSDVWANPLLSTSSPSEWLHPNAKGYSAWADRMIRAILFNVGGVDLNGYCQSLGDDGVSLDGTTAYDWHCVAGGARDDLDMVDACGWQYGPPNVGDWQPRYSDFNDPYSWSCWRL